MADPVAAVAGGYAERRAWIANYFDRTASHHWAALTSDAPVGRIRRTVRAGRERMASTLLSWLPDDLQGMRVLDAGCGPGVLSLALARRGAHVVAVDLAESLLDVAKARTKDFAGPGRIEWHAGDMLDATLGTFDYVVAMDSLIHYGAADLERSLAALGARTRGGIVFTFAPRTPALSLMHAVGRLIPRGTHRAPAIQPISPGKLFGQLLTRRFAGWTIGRSERISSGFYTSQALELVRSSPSHLAPQGE